MKYIIMCGGQYNNFETPRQLSVVNGEELVARTIRLLRENGIEDIAISSNNPIFKKYNIPVLEHENSYVVSKDCKIIGGQWFDAFYPTDEPTCYIFGDVYFSEKAIKTIIETETDDIELFGSKKPFAPNYLKTHEEPFALKVMNTKHLKESIQKARELDEQHRFWRKPIVWELFTVIKDVPLQTKRDEYTTDYVGINDYTVDIDRPEDVKKLNKLLGGIEMTRVEVIKDFTLERFNELENIVRKSRDEKGKLFEGDTFECEKELAEYLMGNNAKGEVVVKVIEIIPPKKVKPVADYYEEPVETITAELKLEKKSKKKKTSKN